MLAMAHPRPSPLWHQRTSYSSKCLLLCWWGNAFLVRDWRVKNSESSEKCGNFWLLAAAVVPWNAWRHLASLVLHLHFMSRNSYLYVLCALPRWLLSSIFPSLAGLWGRQSMIYWHILAMIGYGWRLTQHTSISNQGNSPHVCSCPFFLSFPIISDSNLPHTHPNIMVGGETAHILRSHSKVGLVKHRETSPETSSGTHGCETTDVKVDSL